MDGLELFSPFLPQLPLLGLRRFISRRRRCSLLSSASSLHRAFPAQQRRGCYCEGPDDNPRRIWKGKDNVNFTLLRRSTFVRGILSKYWASIIGKRGGLDEGTPALAALVNFRICSSPKLDRTTRNRFLVSRNLTKPLIRLYCIYPRIGFGVRAGGR